MADEGFLANPDDMESVKNIYRIYIKNIASELARIDPSYQLISPDPVTLDNDEQLESFIKENFDHNHHQQGSLRMAPLRKGGVVDHTGSVHGVKDFIVADVFRGIALRCAYPKNAIDRFDFLANAIGLSIDSQWMYINRGLSFNQWLWSAVTVIPFR
ncbi:choline dehydrogenase [Paenibacillus popilliae ATCC 14706]|uniref:Choline dehydrogenase n=1 Tax=Paenibacillus popilliae ATCC 14706 TaxID=1212764 RepID=M9LQP9_PAEPP|nr:choline dehydrogenase [Paenibacillus popilliae ATCC 14706]